MVYRGLVKDGVVVIETGVAFEEGTVVNVEAAEPGAGCAVLCQTRTGIPDCAYAEASDRLIDAFPTTSRTRQHQRQDVL